MKILHCADLHLGVESYGRFNPDTGLSTRLEDFLATFDRVVGFAIDNKVDLVLFCGDAYKSREPSQTHQREFAKRIRRLVTSGIPLFLLVGNHDLSNAIGGATTPEIFDTLAVDKVYVSGKPQIHRIQTASGALQICSLPWLRRSTLLTREDNKNLTPEGIKQKLQQVLTDAVSSLVHRLDPQLPAVLAAHVWVTSARVGSENSMVIGQEPALLLSTVTSHAFDYVALGHIHRHQVLHLYPPVVYSGSLDRLDFGDEDDEKGFYLVEIGLGDNGERKVKFNFQPLDGRRFLTISAAIEPGDSDPTATVLNTIACYGESLPEAIVRLNISMSAESQAGINDGEIRNALKIAHYSTIAREITREARPRLGNLTAEGLAPAQALEAWLKTQQHTPERSEVLLRYGEKLIEHQRDNPPK